LPRTALNTCTADTYLSEWYTQYLHALSVQYMKYGPEGYTNEGSAHFPLQLPTDVTCDLKCADPQHPTWASAVYLLV